MSILRIAVPTPLARTFDYLPTDNLDIASVQAGMRVEVPFQRRILIGVVLEIVEQSDVPKNKLRKISRILDDAPLLSLSLLSLAKWASEYYHHPIGEVIATMLPTLLRKGSAAQPQLTTFYRLTGKGATLDLQNLSRAPKQQECITMLQQAQQGLEKHQFLQVNISPSVLRTLLEKGLIESYQAPAPQQASDANITPGVKLNEEQQIAVTTIKQNLREYQTFLLEGVTGSGKTEVYLQLIAHILKQGRQALVLIPEIGLTPQTVARFQRRFNLPIALFHSRLNERERLEAWLQAKNGGARIIIGTRSAVFMPLQAPGIIIIDEEHDLSFKQQEGFRYSARDLALVRAQHDNIPVVLGSATPSLESLCNVQRGRFRSLTLSQRAGQALQPEYRIIDVRGQRLEEGVSTKLLHLIKKHLHDGNQVLLFLNRRGYAPVLICHSCGWVAECWHCDARMTLHQQPQRLHCHHCGATRPRDVQCPACKGRQLLPLGLGTERLETAIQRHFSLYPVYRIDSDTTRRKGAMQGFVERIHDGKACILLGTQMLAKGHHFPKVTLVAILDVDGSLYSADFRAAERLAQLFIQVAGRSGRADLQGEVAIQTHHPRHPLLHTLIYDGYHEYALQALEERKQIGLPPYGYMALLRARARQRDNAFAFLHDVKYLVEKIANQQAQALGPIPAVMERRAGYFRAQLLIQSQRRSSLHRVLNALTLEISELKSASRVKWSLDVDPLDMY